MHFSKGFGVGIAIAGVAATAVIAACVGDSSSGASTSPDAGSATDTGTVIANDGSLADAGSIDGNAPVDAGGDAAQPMCNPTKPFSAPTMVTSLDVVGDEGTLRLSSDYLTGYYATTPADGGPGMLYSAQRPSIGAPFGPSQLLAGIFTPGSSGDSHPSVSGDGLSLYFDQSVSVDAGGLGMITTYLASRANTSQTFGAPSTVQGVSSETGANEPFIREDGQALYFTATGANAVPQIYRALKGPSGFATPTLVSELNTNAGEDLATVTPDDLVIYFNSFRTDGGAKGGYDIWVATRTSTAAPFGTPVNVSELNTADGDRPNFITRDRCTLYFHRSYAPDGSAATRSIWVATKSP